MLAASQQDWVFKEEYEKMYQNPFDNTINILKLFFYLRGFVSFCLGRIRESDNKDEL